MIAPLIIDGSNALLGRLASYAAKQALLGKTVVIVNCTEIVISGDAHMIGRIYSTRRARGGSAMKGPNFPRGSQQIVKRTIRGMLPHRQARGSDALKRIRCYNAIPLQYKESSLIKAGKEKPLKTLRMGELSSRL